MYSFSTSSVPDNWSEADMNYWQNYGSQRDKVMYIPGHNAKVRVVEDIFLCSFKQKDGTFKNVYVCPITNSLFLFIIGVPHLEALLDVKSDTTSCKLIEKTPLLGKIYKNLRYSSNYDLTNDVSILKEGIIVKVHAKVEDFIFPRHRKIENPECVKKYALVSNLYNEIANEYNAVYDAYQKIVSDYEDKKNELIASSLLRVGISIGMMAITGVLLPDLDLLFDDFSYSGDYVPDTDVLDFDYGFNLDDYYLADSDLGFDTSMDYDSELDIDNSGQYNISFQGKSVDKLIDQKKLITVRSAGGGPSYQLDVYHDNNNNVWVAKKNSSIAEKITGLTQVSVGGTKFVVSAIKALL